MKPSVVVAAALLVAAHPWKASLAQEAVADRADPGRQISLGIGGPQALEENRAEIGVAVGVVQDYEGSDNFGLKALPLVDLAFPQFFVKGAGADVNDGLASAGLTFLHFGYSDAAAGKAVVLLGPLIRYRGRREEGANDALDGLGDVGGSLEIGGFMKASAGPWSADLTAAQDVADGHGGLLIALGTRYAAEVSDKFTITGGLSASWASENYMQSNFGITGRQAARSGIAPFDAEAGFKDVGLQLRASYAFAAHWSLEAQVGYRYLLADAGDSPLVDDTGSPHQFRALAGLTYRF